MHMQKLTLLFAFVSLLFSCKSQPAKDSSSTSGEFNKNKNGLIYSETDINALRFVVDSLNLRFKTCDVNKIYKAYPQATAYEVRFESKTNDLTEIRDAQKDNPLFYDLVNKYGAYVKKTDSNILVAATGFDDDGKQTYLSGTPYSGFEGEYMLRGKPAALLNGWVYDYKPKGEYNDYYSLSCFYFPKAMQYPEIPAAYAKLIQYIDCMIDTSATIFLTKKYDYVDTGLKAKCDDYRQLVEYVNTKMPAKNTNKKSSVNSLTNDKIQFINTRLRDDEFVLQKINNMVEWCRINEQGYGIIEPMAEIFSSQKAALEAKRRERVVGFCSQDQSPRIHALAIAKLAAETHSWDIFLRSHLNIMNDRFERNSDGSYAWGQRKTYIKELEALNINVIDMMLGLSLRSVSTPVNHYNGTVWRIGKALTESGDRLLFENRVKAMMKDEMLDEFNRSLLFLLYQTYLNFLEDKNEKKLKIGEMKTTLTAYPLFIQKAIEKLEANLKDE